MIIDIWSADISTVNPIFTNEKYHNLRKLRFYNVFVLKYLCPLFLENFLFFFTWGAVSTIFEEPCFKNGSSKMVPPASRFTNIFKIFETLNIFSYKVARKFLGIICWKVAFHDFVGTCLRNRNKGPSFHVNQEIHLFWNDSSDWCFQIEMNAFRMTNQSLNAKYSIKNR